MDRRLLTWFVASTLFLGLYMTLNVMFVPQPEREVPSDPLAHSADDPLARSGDEPGSISSGALEASSAEPSGAAAGDADSDAGVGVEGAAADDSGLPPRPQQASWYTLGSMDPESGYFILATLNSRGGTIERLELTERRDDGQLKFRRVDTDSGYLGYLAAESSPEGIGCVVRVVGPGTPAALARSQSQQGDGLQVDDLIIAVGGQAISSPYDLDQALLQTRPEQEVSVEVIRPSVGTEPLIFQATLTEHPLDLVRLSSTGGADEVLGNIDRLSCRLNLSQLGNASIPIGKTSIAGLNWIGDAIYDAQWDPAAQGGATTTFTLPLPQVRLGSQATGDLELVRSYQLPPSSYLIEMQVQIRNLGDQPQRVGYRLESPNGVTLEGWWYSTKISPNYMGGAAARDVVYSTLSESHRLLSGYDLLKRSKKQPLEPDQPIFGEQEAEPMRSLRYAAIDAQYFNVAYLPPAGSDHFSGLRRAGAGVVADPESIPIHQERAVNVGFFLDSEAQELAPQAGLTQSLRLFAGPKSPELLDSLGLGRTIEYGWFSGVSRLLGKLLHGFNWAFGNYALAIILLTVLVRACLFPISRNAAIHAQRMQELAPELKKIAEKHKDDMEARMRAQREFQKRVGFNPLAGCLPALLQLPIFIGLYRCLSVDLELRQEALSSHLLWANNLAGPDMLSYWGDWLWEYLSGRGTGWLGPYFNILPVFVVTLFLIQQKMFMPPATDEQQAMTQRIMTIMTIMMAVFFFRVPAGLCIYFITSSLWGIAERIVVKRTLPPAKPVAMADGAAGVIDGTVVAGGGEKKKTLADRLREQLQPEVPQPLPPNKRKRPSGKRR